MNKRYFAYFALTMFLLMPKFSYADFTAEVEAIEKVTNAQEGGIGKVIKNSIAEHAGVSKDTFNRDFSNISPDTIMDYAGKAGTIASKVFKIDDKLPAGLADKINGMGSNPALRNAAKKAFTVGRRSGDDVKKNAELEDKANDLMIENVSLMYARGLVRRYQLENEVKEEVEDFNNVSGVQTAYLSTIQRANSRWLSMLQNESSLMIQTSMNQVMNIKPDETEEQKGEEKEDAKEPANKAETAPTDKAQNTNTASSPSETASTAQTTKKENKFISSVKNTAGKVGTWVNEHEDLVGGATKVIGGATGNTTLSNSLDKAKNVLSAQGQRAVTENADKSDTATEDGEKKQLNE